MIKENGNTLGVEAEKPISDVETGRPHGISQHFFERVAERTGGEIEKSDISPDTSLAVDVPEIGHIGLDNAFNLQETSTRVTQDLDELNYVLHEDLVTVQEALLAEGASVINLSIHPLATTEKEFYEAMVAPKGVYRYIRQRGWDHTAGIDAKAHNSPNTGIHPEDAARAQTTILGAGAAFIGMFANSPVAEGRTTGDKENRALMWDRFMRNSTSDGDRLTARFPQSPFESLADYFKWMHGDGTNIHFVIADGGNYKTFGDAAVLIDGDPSVLDYLKMEQATGRFMNSGERVSVTPELSHLEAMQFAQFTGARIRYELDHEELDVGDFLEALEADDLERLFSNGNSRSMYIEGRDAGANFPDRHLHELDPNIARSVMIAPSVLQKGLLCNLDEAHAFITSQNWRGLGALRERAITHALEDDEVYDFSKKLLDIAKRGLDESENRHVAYLDHVIETRTTGADRMLTDLENGRDISELVTERNVVIYENED